MKTFLSPLILLFFLGGRLAYAQDALQHFTQGERLISQLKYQEAILSFQKTIGLLHEGSDLAKKARMKMAEAENLEKVFIEQLKSNSLSRENLQKMENILEEGKKLSQQEKWKEARSLFELVLPYVQLNSEVQTLIGNTLIQTGDLAKGKELLGRVLLKDPRYLPALFQISPLLIEEKDFETLRNYLLPEIKQLSLDLEKTKSLALQLQKKGFYDREAEENQKSIGIRSHLGTLNYLAGLTYFLQDKEDNALKFLKNSLKIFPGNLDPLILIGRVFLRKKMYLSASFAFEKTLGISEKIYQDLIQKGNELLEQGENEEVLKVGKQSQSLKEKIGLYYHLLGKTFYRRELTRQAIQMFEKSVEFAPGYVNNSFFLSQVYAREGELGRSIEIIRGVLKSSQAGSENARLALENLKLLLTLSTQKGFGSGENLPGDNQDNPIGEPIPLKDYPVKGSREIEEKIEPVILALKKARGLYQSGKLDEAHDEFRKIIETQGSVLEAFLGLADIAYKKQDFSRELVYLERGRDLDPIDHRVQFQFARSLLNNDRDLPEALKMARNLQESDPKNPEFLHLYGWSLFKNGFIDESIGVFQQVLLLSPKHEAAHYDLAMAYYLNGEFNLAEEFFSKIGDQPPFALKARLFSGLTFLKLKNPGKAKELFTRALALSKQEDPLNKYIKNLLKKLEIGEKLSLIPDSIDLKRPSDSIQWLQKAEEYYRSGIYPRALDTLNFALKKDPHHFESLKFAGKIYFERRFYQKAVEYWVRAVEAEPGAYTVLLGIGKCYYRMKKFAEALEFFGRAYAQEQRDPETAYYLGLVKWNLGDPKGAEKFLKEGINLNHEGGKSHLMLGELFLSQGKDLEARREFILAARSPQASQNVQHLSAAKLRQAESRLYLAKKGPFSKTNNYLDEISLKQKESEGGKLSSSPILAAFLASPTQTLPAPEALDSQISRYKKLQGLKIKEPSYKFVLPNQKDRGNLPKKEKPTYLREVKGSDIFVNRGNQHALNGRLDQALNEYEEGFKSVPEAKKNLELLFNTGLVQTLLLKYASALKSFQSILEVKGNEGLAYNALGNILWFSGDGVLAIRAFKAGKNFPLNVVEPNLLIPYKLAWGRFLDANNLDFDARLNLAVTQLFSGQSLEANQNLETILKVDKYRNDVKFYSGLAKVKIFLEKSDFFQLNQATKQYNEILDLDPNFPQVKKLLLILSDLKAGVL